MKYKFENAHACKFNRRLLKTRRVVSFKSDKMAASYALFDEFVKKHFLQ